MALIAPANLLKASVTSSVLAPYLQIDLTAQILNFSNEFDGPIVIISYHTQLLSATPNTHRIPFFNYA